MCINFAQLMIIGWCIKKFYYWFEWLTILFWPASIICLTQYNKVKYTNIIIVFYLRRKIIINPCIDMWHKRARFDYASEWWKCVLNDMFYTSNAPRMDNILIRAHQLIAYYNLHSSSNLHESLYPLKLPLPFLQFLENWNWEKELGFVCDNYNYFMLSN